MMKEEKVSQNSKLPEKRPNGWSKTSASWP